MSKKKKKTFVYHFNLICWAKGQQCKCLRSWRQQKQRFGLCNHLLSSILSLPLVEYNHWAPSASCGYSFLFIHLLRGCFSFFSLNIKIEPKTMIMSKKEHMNRITYSSYTFFFGSEEVLQLKKSAVCFSDRCMLPIG